MGAPKCPGQKAISTFERLSFYHSVFLNELFVFLQSWFHDIRGGKKENWEYAMFAYLGLSSSSPELSTHAVLHCVLQCSEWNTVYVDFVSCCLYIRLNSALVWLTKLNPRVIPYFCKFHASSYKLQVSQCGISPKFLSVKDDFRKKGWYWA